MLPDIFMNLNSGSPENKGEVPAIEQGETTFSVLSASFCTLLQAIEMTEVRQGRLGDGANVILWCLSQPSANRSSSKHRATVRTTAIACQWPQ